MLAAGFALKDTNAHANIGNASNGKVKQREPANADLHIMFVMPLFLAHFSSTVFCSVGRVLIVI